MQQLNAIEKEDNVWLPEMEKRGTVVKKDLVPTYLKQMMATYIREIESTLTGSQQTMTKHNPLSQMN